MHLLKNPWKIGAGIAPAFLIYTIFCIVPIFVSFYYSFMSWNGFSPMQFVGLANYKAILQDPCSGSLFATTYSSFSPLYLARCRLRSCSL